MLAKKQYWFQAILVSATTNNDNKSTLDLVWTFISFETRLNK